MQISVLIAYTAVLLAAGTNAASFFNLDQSQVQHNAVEVEETGLSTQVTGKRLHLPFPCTPDYKSMVIWPPKKILPVRAPATICFAANGNFAAPSQVGRYYFVIYDESGNLLKNGTFPTGAGVILGCAFSSTALYFADNLEKKIYRYTTDGDHVGTFVTGFEFDRLAAAEGNLYAVVGRNPRTTVRAFNETTGQEKCRISQVIGAKALAFDAQGNLNIAYRGNRIEVYTLDCKYVSTRSYTEVSSIYGFTLDGSSNTVIADIDESKVKAFSPPQCRCLKKELGPFNNPGPVDVGIGKDCSLYVAVPNLNAVFTY